MLTLTLSRLHRWVLYWLSLTELQPMISLLKSGVHSGATSWIPYFYVASRKKLTRPPQDSASGHLPSQCTAASVLSCESTNAYVLVCGN